MAEVLTRVLSPVMCKEGNVKDNLGYMAEAEWVQVAQCGEHNIMNLDCSEQCWDRSGAGKLCWWALLSKGRICPRESLKDC